MGGHGCRSKLGWLLIAVALGGCEAARPAPPPDGRAHLRQAHRYLELDLPDSALAAFGLALVDNPKLVDAHVGMSDIYHRVWENYTLAHRSYESASELAPNRYDAHYGLALMKQLLGRVHAAVAVYLRALALRPDSFEVNEHLASALLQLGRDSEAVAYGERAVRLESGHQGAWANLAAAYNRIGQYEKAVDAYRRAVELGEPAEPVLVGLASAHIHLRRYQLAAIVLRNQNRRRPSALAYERLGYCQFKLRQYDEALACYRAALSMDGDDTASLNGLGVCLMTLHLQSGGKHFAQREEAIRLWRRSIHLRPDQPRISNLIERYRST